MSTKAIRECDHCEKEEVVEGTGSFRVIKRYHIVTPNESHYVVLKLDLCDNCLNLLGKRGSLENLQ